MTTDKRPFKGIKVLDVGRVLASPFAGYQLQRTAQEWEDILNEAGVAAMRVRNIPEILAHPQVRSRGFLHKFDEIPGAGVGATVTMVPFGSSAGGAHVDRPPPVLGAHTDEILGELGYAAADVASLRRQGVI